MRIKRRDYLQEVHEKTGYTEGELRVILNGVRDVLVEHLRNEDTLLLFDGLLVSGVRTPPRIKVNPVGKVCEIPEKIQIKCKPTKALRDAVN